MQVSHRPAGAIGVQGRDGRGVLLAACEVDLEQHVCRGQNSRQARGRQRSDDNGARNKRVALTTVLIDHQVDLRFETCRQGVRCIPRGLRTLAGGAPAESARANVALARANVPAATSQSASDAQRSSHSRISDHVIATM
jgi:hypothetical protein